MRLKNKQTKEVNIMKTKTKAAEMFELFANLGVILLVVIVSTSNILY